MLNNYIRPEDGLDRESRKAETKRLQVLLTAQQPALREAKLPVVVLVEGWAAAGKGGLINKLISDIDPRFSSVFSLDADRRDADRYPFLHPFFSALPENGKLLFMDGGWMEAAVRDRLCGGLSKEDYRQRIYSVNRFERQLRDNGYLVLKLFVHISEKEQARRQKRLLADRDTAWRVSDYDRRQNGDYSRWLRTYEEFMTATGDVFPWHVLDGSGKKKLNHDAFRLLTDLISAGLAAGRFCGEPFEAAFPMAPAPRLSEVDLSPRLEEAEYRRELDELQERLARLHNTVYRKRIPVIVCFEGWDAAGKGGSIRRLAYPLDPRGFETWPISSPEPHELARHYLWRFWTRLPRSGHVAIFDRTWYGRVMVERIEGFCSRADWQRAYNEINEFEADLYDWGAVILKFWLHIDPETQLQRFTERQNTPEKQWKITDEDWRNREKWPLYEEAVNDMLEKTSTEFAPWHVVESDDKLYARIKVMRIVADAMEKAVKERD